MSIDYCAKLMIGLRRCEFTDQNLLEEWVQNGTLEVAPPYYDGGGEDHAVVGLPLLETGRFGNREFVPDPAKEAELRAQFLKLTELPPKLYLCTHGS